MEQIESTQPLYVGTKGRDCRFFGLFFRHLPFPCIRCRRNPIRSAAHLPRLKGIPQLVAESVHRSISMVAFADPVFSDYVPDRSGRCCQNIRP